MILSPGEIVDGRFEVEALVGEGGLAEVYRVRHRELGRVMALKLLTWRKKSLMERLVLEGRIQAQLDHPNIVSVIDLIRHEGQVGLLMEYVDAENLHDHVQRVGATPQAEALELISPILSAVDAAHSVGITHRDLKPGNIMLARIGTGIVPKVTDFGIAKVVQEVTTDVGHQTRAGSAMGTPGYLAPEQVTDASTIDGRADVFALGAIAYEILTGVPAFADEDGHIGVTATATLEPVPVEERVDVTPCVAEAIREALTKDLSGRTPSIAALAEKLLNSRPDLLTAFRSHQVKPLNLSLPPTDESGTFRRPTLLSPDASAAARSVSPTIAPPPLPSPTTESSMPAAAGGWLVAGMLGTLLLLTLLVGAAGLIFLGAGRGSGEASPVAAAQVPVVPAPAVPAPAVPVPAVPDAAAPVPQAAAASRPKAEPTRARPRPTAVPEPVPEPVAPPPPERTVEAAKADPVVISVPSTAAEAAPVAAAAQALPPTYPAISGAWSGKAGAQRISVALARSGESLSGTFTLYAGTQVRQEPIRGSIRSDGSVSFTAGDMTFTGSATASAMSGTYMRQGAKKSQRWSASK